MRANKAAPEWVYFVQEGTSGPIKIGATSNVIGRTRSLQLATWRTLNLLGACKGGRDLERALHARFRSHEIAGEWFHPVPDLLGYVAEHARLPESMPRVIKGRVQKLNGSRRDDTLAFRLTLSDSDALRHAAREEGVSMSELVRRLINQALAEEPQ